MKTLASSTSVYTEEDRNLETAANEKLKMLGSECRIASLFTRNTGTGTMHGVVFRGAPILIEQQQPFTVDELVKAAQLHSQARTRRRRSGRVKQDTCRLRCGRGHETAKHA